MKIEAIEYSNFFFLERRLLMNYYPGKWAGLSEWAFKRYVVMCSNVRLYNKDRDISCVYSSLNHMVRGAGMTTEFQYQYEAANEELCNKHFIKRRPDLDKYAKTYYELLTLPDYIGGGNIFQMTL